MTVPSTSDAAGWLRNHLESDDADQDLARSMLAAFAEALMSAEASMQCQAAYGERSDERVNSRNDDGIELFRASAVAVERYRYRGTNIPTPWASATRKITRTSGMNTWRADAMQVDVRFGGRTGETPDREIGRALRSDPYMQKVREGDRVVNVSAVVAAAVNVEGRREVVGFDIVTTESTTAWTGFLRSLVARGLSGVELVTSDAHGGIEAAIAAVLSEASWQRCHTHFMASLATRVPEGELADDRHPGAFDLRAARP